MNIWRDTIVYDELTINERQKKDGLFVNLLDQVRRGSPTPESLQCLKLRVIDETSMSISAKVVPHQSACFLQEKLARNLMTRCGQ